MQSAASMGRKQSWCAALHLGQSMLADHGCACTGLNKAKSPLHVKIALCDQDTLGVADTALHQA